MDHQMRRCLRFTGLCFLLSATLLITNRINQQNQTKQLTQQLQEVANQTKKEEGTPLYINPPQNLEDPYWDYIAIPFLEVDFTELQRQNSDTVAWIQVPNTNIDYPVVQTSNNTYYLNHAFDHAINDAGWIFSDFRNNLQYPNNNTVIYGHGRIEGTMFGSLKNILESSWYTNKNNHIIKLSTPTENTMWQVFSVYTIPKESYYITPSFNSTEAYGEFLNTMKIRSEVDFSAEVNTNDKILTLSTCKDNFGNRVVMHAKLIKRETR